MSYRLHMYTVPHQDPVLTLKVTGDPEMFRYAYYLAHGPVDTLHLARKVFRYLHRRWGHDRFVEHDRRITGGKVVGYGWHKDPTPED